MSLRISNIYAQNDLYQDDCVDVGCTWHDGHVWHNTEIRVVNGELPREQLLGLPVGVLDALTAQFERVLEATKAGKWKTVSP